MSLNRRFERCLHLRPRPLRADEILNAEMRAHETEPCMCDLSLVTKIEARIFLKVVGDRLFVGEEEGFDASAFQVWSRTVSLRKIVKADPLRSTFHAGKAIDLSIDRVERSDLIVGRLSVWRSCVVFGVGAEAGSNRPQRNLRVAPRRPLRESAPDRPSPSFQTGRGLRGSQTRHASVQGTKRMDARRAPTRRPTLQ